MSIRFSEVKFSNCKHPKYQPHLKHKKIILNLEDIEVYYKTELVGAARMQQGHDLNKFEQFIPRAKLNFANYCIVAKNLETFLINNGTSTLNPYAKEFKSKKKEINT